MLDIEYRIKPLAWLRKRWALPSIALAAFIVCIGLIYIPWGKNDVDWPAWVQAVGSLIGICIAIAVPAWQMHQSVREKKEAALRAAYENAVMGHKACIEVDQFLSRLIKLSSGNRFGWHDSEFFRVWAATLQRRFALLIEKEATSQWWSLFLTAQVHLMEINAALRTEEINSPLLGALAEATLEKWSVDVEPVREKLRMLDSQHPEWRSGGLWD